MATAGSDWKTNPQTQIRWGASYIKGRYKDPLGAWAPSKRRTGIRPSRACASLAGQRHKNPGVVTITDFADFWPDEPELTVLACRRYDKVRHPFLRSP